MARCTAAERTRANSAAAVVEAHERVVGVDVLPPAQGLRDRWTLEITVDDCARGVPPTVLEYLGASGFYVETVQPRGSGRMAVATP